MDWKKFFNLNEYQWWRNHRRIITFGGILVSFGLYIQPFVQEAKNKNKCVAIAYERFLAESSGNDQMSKDSSFVLGYQVCNHRSQ